MANYINALAPQFTVVTDRPNSLFVTLTQARDHVQLFGDTSQDAILQAYIGAAQETAEGLIGQELFPTTYNAYYPRFQSNGLLIPRLNLAPQSTVIVQYYDGTNTLQTLPAAAYYTDPTSFYPVVYPIGTAADVTVSGQFESPWIVSFTAQLPEAYSTQAGATDRITSAILMFVGDLYSYRNSGESMKYSEITVTTAERLLRKYRPATL